MLESPKATSLIDSIVRIILIITIFYMLKHFYAFENDLILALVSVLCGHVLLKVGRVLFRKATTKQ